MKKFIRNFKDQQSINKHLFCSICHEVFRRPVIIACGHTFCKHCIQLWKVNHKFCPNCRQTIQKKDSLLKNLIPQQIIDELEMNCASEECRWTGQLQDLEKHYSQCQFFKKIKQPEDNQDTKNAITIEEEQLIDDDDSDVEIVEVKELKQSSSIQIQKEQEKQNSKIGVQKAIQKPAQKGLLNKLQVQRKLLNNNRVISSSVYSSQQSSDNSDQSSEFDQDDSYQNEQNNGKRLKQKNKKLIDIEDDEDEVNLIKDVRKRKINISYDKVDIQKNSLQIGQISEDSFQNKLSDNHLEQIMEIEGEQNDIDKIIKKNAPIDLLNEQEDADENSIKDIQENFHQIYQSNKNSSSEKNDTLLNGLNNNCQIESPSSKAKLNSHSLYNDLRQNVQMDEMQKSYSTYLQKFSSSKQDKDSDLDQQNSDLGNKKFQGEEENLILDDSIVSFQYDSPKNQNKNQSEEEDDDDNLIKNVDQKQSPQKSQNQQQENRDIDQNQLEGKDQDHKQYSPSKILEENEEKPHQNSNKKQNLEQDELQSNLVEQIKENEKIENIKFIDNSSQQIDLQSEKKLNENQVQQNIQSVNSQKIYQNKNQEESQLEQQQERNTQNIEERFNIQKGQEKFDIEQEGKKQEGQQLEDQNAREQELEEEEEEAEEEEEEESKCNRAQNNQSEQINYNLQNVDYKQFQQKEKISSKNEDNKNQIPQNNQEKLQDFENNKLEDPDQQKKKNPIIDILFGFWKN